MDMKIKNLVFDFGKVLVDYDFIPVMKAFFKDDTLREEEFRKIFISDEFIDECDREVIPFAEIIRNRQMQHPELADALQYFYDHYTDFVIGEMPGMRDMLTWLKSQGFRLYGLTNWCSRVHEVMEKYDIFKLLDGEVISSEEHLLKPQPEIYQRLCQRFGLIPEESLFADDKDVNVEGARAIGMKAVKFVDATTYARDLRQIICESNTKCDD